MKIVVSACLLGESCKYNGKNNYNENIVEFVRGHEVTAVCPEVLGGLAVPRQPAEIVNGIVMTREGVSVDKEFREGAAKALKETLDEGAELAILQSRSPSCGCRQIYDGSFGGKLIEGQGIFARMLEEAGIKTVDAEEIAKTFGEERAECMDEKQHPTVKGAYNV